MRPIETPESDTRFVGGPGVDDLPVQVLTELQPESGLILRVNRARWRPDALERMAIALGGDVVVDVMGATLAPYRVLASTMPVGTPERVYAAVDEILANGIAWSLSTTLGELGIAKTIEEVRAWTEDDTKAVADWMAEHPEDEAKLEEWIAAAPECVR